MGKGLYLDPNLGQNGETDMKWKYQLILQFPFSGLNDYDPMTAFEEVLTVELGNRVLIDGHDAGSGEMNIFIHTNDPKGIFNEILSSHAKDKLIFHMKAAYRENAVTANKYVILWPKGLQKFRVS